jgi:hypothetical protein
VKPLTGHGAEKRCRKARLTRKGKKTKEKRIEGKAYSGQASHTGMRRRIRRRMTAVSSMVRGRCFRILPKKQMEAARGKKKEGRELPGPRRGGQ